jgi:hypothetical protein
MIQTMRGEMKDRDEAGGKDPRYRESSPHYAGDQDAPEPERPMSGAAGDEPGPEDKPSQAEGERSLADADGA